jgi:cysteinyl-tRNA synthetase
MFFLQTHYRSKIDFTWKGLEEATKLVGRFGFLRLKLNDAVERERIGCADRDVPLAEAAKKLRLDFAVAMDDDFHTPSALAALFEFQRRINPILEEETETSPVGAGAANDALEALQGCGEVLTLFEAAIKRPATSAGSAPESLLEAARGCGIALDDSASEASLMAKLLDARSAARARKDWKGSDAIRAAAKEAGYLIEDTPGGQRWRRA